MKSLAKDNFCRGHFKISSAHVNHKNLNIAWVYPADATRLTECLGLNFFEFLQRFV